MLTEENLAPAGETLLADDYRRLWLATAAELGLVAECLAEALDWKPSSDTDLPDALMLAGAAADRIALLTAQLMLTRVIAPQSMDALHLTIYVN